MNRTTWTFNSAGQIVFGQHAVKRLGEAARRLQVERVLIVTDQVLTKAGILDQARGPLVESGIHVEVFDGGEPEPSIRAAEECDAVAVKTKPDCILGLGGGSNMDLAKAATVTLAHGGKILDYAGEDNLPGPVKPLICVPTTAGTGSEVSPGAVLTDTENHIKIGVMSNYLRPSVAVVDPLLTVSCPLKVTADSGIDALTHAIEAYTAVENSEFPVPEGQPTVYQGRHPMGDMVAEKAINLVARFLRRAVANGNDLEARENMALAATLAGLAFSNVGVALVHALEYPVGGAVHCSHGEGNGLLLPYVMKFNLPVRRKRLAETAHLMGCDTTGMTEGQAALQAIEKVEQLRADIGIPQRLSELGVTKEMLPGFAEKAVGIQRILRVNPRRPTMEELLGIYQEAL